MKDEYFKYYILSYFDLEKITTESQIVHVIHAKRTPSMFYLIELNGWHHGFSLPNKISREQLSKIIKNLLGDSYLIEKEKGFVLTEKGQLECAEYFQQHYYPQRIKSFSNAKIRRPFWNRFQLFTQVFSEYSYQNTKYVPIVKHPHHQENIRQLFQQFSSNKEQLLMQWYTEQQFLFEQLDKQVADVLINQLTGHDFIGRTRSQLAAYYQMTPWEFSFYFRDAVEEVLQLIQQYTDQLPLNKEIVQILHLETHLGLSASTFETYERIKQGANLSDIARQRSIKENTVREHILEMAFTFEHFPYQKFIPSDIYQSLNHYFDEIENFNYQKAIKEINQLEFMHYRLVELERMRLK